MRSNALFQQCTWLVNLIKRYRKLTLDEINKHWLNHHLSEHNKMSRSTFNRHREAIQDMFGIVIECDIKGGYTYYISNPEILEENSIQNWMFSTLSVNSILSENKGLHSRILLEQIPSDGDNLHLFISAMKHGKRIKVEYQKYQSDEVKIWVLEPYFVKLFKKRWYAIVKHVEPDAALFTLAFDRIKSLEILDETYVYDASFDPAGWFDACYGIVRNPEVPIQRVVIRAYGREVHYLRDLPFHPSQKEVEETSAYSDFELFLSPTPDFYTPLVSRGPAIKILEPQWLADEIKRLHMEAFQLYTL
jgi:hypothetical protein